ncbi:MAG: hypothetical protein M1830_004587 [Pleopsidium flavum]|nr:MAG: hypothetical protein M1830_004587 [Pleopsidium flavum]
MALYYEAASLLTTSPDGGGSHKSRIYNSKDLKSNPAHLFALISEASKWSAVLKEVIEESGVLSVERKLTPSLALLLVHDQLLSKRGIVAPASHPFKVAVTKHKARLNAEFTKARLRRGFASLAALRAAVSLGYGNKEPSLAGEEAHLEAALKKGRTTWTHPRWVRINTIRSTLKEQLATTFADSTRIENIEELLRCSPDSQGHKLLHIDHHVPNLLALPATIDLTGTSAYRKGEIIFQDKASCFPAYLLNPTLNDGDIIDTCAAPGNKTTHVSALLQENKSLQRKSRIIACEKDKGRAITLQKMVDWAGVHDMVSVKAGQDFLKLDPENSAYKNVGALLLDPSCSGSGIVGRDNIPHLVLPSRDIGSGTIKHGKKRKRPNQTNAPKPVADTPPEEETVVDASSNGNLQERLRSLSAFQLKLISHAFRFPSARKIIYSTCSIHAEENEYVVIEALRSPQAEQRGWRILKREEQVVGMREWGIRGDRQDCERLLDGSTNEEVEAVIEGCIRCEKGTKEGTMGFFVACFIRDAPLSMHAQVGDPVDVNPSEDENGSSTHALDDPAWQGFSDEDSVVTSSQDAPNPRQVNRSHKQKNIAKRTKS